MGVPGNKLRVVVVDDSEVVRMKLRGLLEADQAFELVGEADSGEAGLEILRQQQPDLVVMDLKMPGMSGIEATWQAGSISPTTRVLVLTVSEEQEDVTDAIMAGARGYVVKGAKDEEITAALRGVAAGERVISPQVAGKLIERVRGEGESRGPTTPSPAAPAAPRVRTPPPRPAAPAAPRAPQGAEPGEIPVVLVQLIGLVGGVLVAAIGVGDEIVDGTTSNENWIKAALIVVVAMGIANLVALLVRLSD